MSDTKRKKKGQVRKAAKVGVVAAVALGLLGLFSFSFPGLGGTDGGTGDGDVQVKTESPAPETETPDEDNTSEPAGPAKEQPSLQPLDLVDVVIDGDDYWVGIGIKDGDVVRETKTLEQITAACATVPGDESGVTVRVSRTFQATAQAERALMSALTDASINEDAIDHRRTLTDFTPSENVSE